MRLFDKPDRQRDLLDLPFMLAVRPPHLPMRVARHEGVPAAVQYGRVAKKRATANTKNGACTRPSVARMVTFTQELEPCDTALMKPAVFVGTLSVGDPHKRLVLATVLCLRSAREWRCCRPCNARKDHWRQEPIRLVRSLGTRRSYPADPVSMLDILR
jgi:hypothetical protein